MKALRWNIADAVDQDRVREFCQSLNNISPAICEILLRRGVDTVEKARAFFCPDPDQLHDPFLMKDMDKAVDRILQAMEKGEKILVYGDYDVDGTTAVSVVYSFFSKLGVPVAYYIPDRHTEGYGISFQGIDYAAENGFALIIALDCGIKSTDKVSYAKGKNIDFIICDHHLPGEILPEACAVLDPKRDDCHYPFKELSGCGVGFKLIQALCIHQGWPAEEAFAYLDLVAVSIAADIVSLTGENRVLAHFGLEQLCNQPKRPGLHVLLQGSTLKREISVSDLVFIVAPRINAAGRIRSGADAVRLLIETDVDLAVEVSRGINDNNSLRKDLDQQITREALEMIEASEETRNGKSTVVYSENWHKGVVGIVASRLTESYYRPTVVLTCSGGKATGSARSVTGFDVYSAIEACSEVLDQFGGHRYAAGLTLPVEKIPLFRELFEKAVAGSISEEMLQPELLIDGELPFSEITPGFYRILKRMGPFGPDNMQPVFYSTDVFDTGFVKVVAERHLKCRLFTKADPDIKLNAIAFKLADKLPLLRSGNPCKIAFTIEENFWNDTVSLQLVIRDIRPMDEPLSGA